MRIKKMQHKADAVASAIDKSRGVNLFNHSALIDMLAEVIKTSVIIGMRDIPKLTVTKINIGAKVDTIDRAVNDIRKEISKIVALTDDSKEFMENDHAYEVYRLVSNMAFMKTEDLRAFNDGTDQHRKYNNEKKD